MPVLTIIAVPNGAGKSTHSKELLAHSGIEAFDFDKEFYFIWSQFSFDPVVEPGAFNKALGIYDEKKSDVLQCRRNFAFETNYHTSQVLSTVDLFRANGYLLELIFICLENPEIAIERVKDRVVKGGHPVEETTIRKRFTNGLKLLDESFHQFDTVYIYLSKHKIIEGILVLDPPRKKATTINPFPAMLESQLPHLWKFVREASQ